jgi:ferric-dicitrate binding protein FerR (iron transport regulator)
MPATIPIDRTTFTSLRDGDEHALEQLFRAQYEPLCEEARAELDDPALAALVVEEAIVRAWEERARCETPEAFERFLHQSVHAAAVRERSRRAAVHRFEEREGVHLKARAAHAPPSVDVAWAQINAVLHAPPVDREAAAHRRHDVSRHEAAHHVAEIGKRRPWVGPAAFALVLGLLVVVAARWFDRTSIEMRVERALASTEARVRSTKLGEQAAVTLTDGSRVQLGAATTLRIPPTFGQLLRPLGLAGSASFTVTPDAEAPFVVRAGRATVAAVGTAFDVRAYPGDAFAAVRVRTGAVEVTVGEATRRVGAGQMVAIAEDGTMRELTSAEARQAFAWTEQRFIVAGHPLEQALAEIERWYGLTITARDPALLTRAVTLDVALGSAREMIAALEQSARVKFGYDDDRKMVLTNAGAS